MDNNVDIYNGLSMSDVAIIFSIYLKCHEYGTCDNCVLNEHKINGHRVGCLKLRDIAMQKVIDIYGNRENENG
jgi:hypothetical protein